MPGVEEVVHEDDAKKEHTKEGKNKRDKTPVKDKAAKPAPKTAKKAAGGENKRVKLLADNLRNKNLLNTDLNRKLKAATEQHQKEKLIITKKNTDLLKQVKLLEK